MKNGFVEANGSFETANFDLSQEGGATSLAVVSDDGRQYIVDLTSRQISYCSMVAKTEEEQAVLFNAMNAPEKRIKDCINLPIVVKDVFVEVVYPENETTGQREPAPRIVLIDENGTGYQTVSTGIYTAMKKIFQSFGEPSTWKTPKTFMVKQINKGERSVLTLEAVLPKKK